MLLAVPVPPDEFRRYLWTALALVLNAAHKYQQAQDPAPLIYKASQAPAPQHELEPECEPCEPVPDPQCLSAAEQLRKVKSSSAMPGATTAKFVCFVTAID